MNPDDMYAGKHHGEKVTENTAKTRPTLRTHGNGLWDILNPNPDDVSLTDIAHSLSNQGRFNGHTHTLYSVAQHAVMVAQETLRIAGPKAALWGLHHDDEETYTGDMAGPLKNLPEMKAFRDIALKTSQAIEEAFGLSVTEVERGIVNRVDAQMLATEMRDLLQPIEYDHLRNEPPLLSTGFEPLDHIRIGTRPIDWSPVQVQIKAPLPPAVRLSCSIDGTMSDIERTMSDDEQQRYMRGFRREEWRGLYAADKSHPHSPFVTVDCWTPEQSVWQFLAWDAKLFRLSSGSYIDVNYDPRGLTIDFDSPS